MCPDENAQHNRRSKGRPSVSGSANPESAPPGDVAAAEAVRPRQLELQRHGRRLSRHYRIENPRITRLKQIAVIAFLVSGTGVMIYEYFAFG